MQAVLEEIHKQSGYRLAHHIDGAGELYVVCGSLGTDNNSNLNTFLVHHQFDNAESMSPAAAAAATAGCLLCGPPRLSLPSSSSSSLLLFFLLPFAFSCPFYWPNTRQTPQPPPLPSKLPLLCWTMIQSNPFSLISSLEAHTYIHRCHSFFFSFPDQC